MASFRRDQHSDFGSCIHLDAKCSYFTHDPAVYVVTTVAMWEIA